MQCTYRLHLPERRRNLASFVRELCYPKSLLIFTDVHSHDGDLISRRKLGKLFFHRFDYFGSFEKPPRAIFTQIQNQNQSQRFASLSFASEVGDWTCLAVIKNLKILLGKTRYWQVRFLVFDERIEKDHTRLDSNRVFNFLSARYAKGPKQNEEHQQNGQTKTQRREVKEQRSD